MIPLSLSDVVFIFALIPGCKVVFEVCYESRLLFLLFLTAGKESENTLWYLIFFLKKPTKIGLLSWYSLIFLVIIHLNIVEVMYPTCRGLRGPVQDNQLYVLITDCQHL